MQHQHHFIVECTNTLQTRRRPRIQQWVTD